VLEHCTSERDTVGSKKGKIYVVELRGEEGDSITVSAHRVSHRGDRHG